MRTQSWKTSRKVTPCGGSAGLSIRFTPAHSRMPMALEICWESLQSSTISRGLGSMPYGFLRSIRPQWPTSVTISLTTHIYTQCSELSETSTRCLKRHINTGSRSSLTTFPIILLISIHGSKSPAHHLTIRDATVYLAPSRAGWWASQQLAQHVWRVSMDL